MMIKHITRIVALALTLTPLLSGCGLAQSVTDSSKKVAKAVFYKKVKVVHLQFRSRAELNPDEDGMALATRVQVYQLKDRKTFDKADYNALVDSADVTLSEDIVAKKEIQVRPEQTINFTMPMDEQAQYVAVVAQYRTPDVRKNDWRLVLARDDLDPGDVLRIEMSKYSLTLMNQLGK
ncbi:type VI secretion system lipoprotein TssJ [Enterobacter asburiae]|nr:type VI secretion system lipoprotein TssJ [Enterobacter asburiae]